MKEVKFILISIFCSVAAAYAQTGFIKGKVKDSKTGEELIGVNVVIEGTTTGSSTDIQGDYTISGVREGDYTLVVSFVSYKISKVSGVRVNAGKTTTINVALEEDNTVLEGVVIIGQRETASEISVIAEIKESTEVVSGISSEQISKTQDRDAAQVVRRIPGITLVDDRFIVVRGLSERYNTIMINDTYAPSTEAETRAFSFDIIPSTLLDRLMVYKSGSAELPGEFGGAVVKIYTKNTVPRNYFSVNLTGGYRHNTTFKNSVFGSSRSLDWLGFGDTQRSLPEAFPRNYREISFDREAVLNESRKFQNDWALNYSTARPDVRFRLESGKAFNIGKAQVGVINSVSYSNTFQYNKIERFRYYNYQPETRLSVPFFRFEDEQFNNDTRLGLLSNWSLILNARNKINFRNMYTRMGNHETTLRTGQDIDKQFDLRNYSLRYRSRTILTSQLEGIHDIYKDRLNFTWLVAGTISNRNEPDWRRVGSRRVIGSGNDFQVLVPQNANASDGSRFFQELGEVTLAQSSSIEYKLTDKEAGSKIKMGYFVQNRNREFNARNIGYIKAGNQFDDLGIGQLPFDQIFAQQNIRFPDGIVIAENTKYTDSYTASSRLLAGYVSTFIPVSDFNFNLGVRVENYNQTLKTSINPATGRRDGIDTTITSPFPFANIAYNLSNKSLIRLAYSKSINRPEFREIAPFSFYDFNFEVDIVGNPTLQFCEIDNVDLRWEHYPTPQELINFGLFYKYFWLPIESIIVTGANNPVFVYANAKSAYALGVETEIRKYLYSINETKKFFNNSYLQFNASLIASRIDLGNANSITQDRVRPLQGQSPYVVNAAYGYEDPEKGIQLNISYNIYGRRIFRVGDPEFPTIYEMPRHLLDMTFTKRLTEKIEGRVGISDLLNAQLKLVEDGNLDGKLNNKETDQPILKLRNGQYFTIGFTIKL